MLPSGLPDYVDDGEDLARFLTQSNQFNDKLVKPALFLPDQNSRETSVSRHGREPKEGLWKLGVRAAGARKLYGAAILKTHVVRNLQLEVVADEPPPRHAVIQGWPWIDSDPALQKAKQKELAIALASATGPPFLRQELKI
jgi:hypothetical protein